MEYCISVESLRAPGLLGEVAVEVTIDREGHARVDSVYAAGRGELGRCIADALQSNGLPRTDDGGPARVRFTLVIEPLR
jgi:hypothetical protein